MKYLHLFEEFEAERIYCMRCGWKWRKDQGGHAPYKCHKCGHNNAPLQESELNLDDLIWQHLSSLVSFPELLQQNEPAWGHIVMFTDYDDYYESVEDREDVEPIAREDYERYGMDYAEVGDAQISFDDFIAGLLGYTELEHHIQEEHPPIEWYMEHFGQSRTVASMMKASVDGNLNQLDLDPEWSEDSDI
jgi:hypothetical protein